MVCTFCTRAVAPGLRPNGRPWKTCCRGCGIGGAHDAACEARQPPNVSADADTEDDEAAAPPAVASSSSDAQPHDYHDNAASAPVTAAGHPASSAAPSSSSDTSDDILFEHAATVSEVHGIIYVTRKGVEWKANNQPRPAVTFAPSEILTVQSSKADKPVAKLKINLKNGDNVSHVFDLTNSSDIAASCWARDALRDMLTSLLLQDSGPPGSPPPPQRRNGKRPYEDDDEDDSYVRSPDGVRFRIVD